MNVFYEIATHPSRARNDSQKGVIPMVMVRKLLTVASKLGKPEEVLANALKKEAMVKVLEMENIVEKMEKRFGVSLEEFEKNNLLDKLGHTWEIEQDYYEWDRASTEMNKLKEIVGALS